MESIVTKVKDDEIIKRLRAEIEEREAIDKEHEQKKLYETLSAKEFLINRSNQTAFVNVDGYEIEVKSYLSNEMVKKHKEFIDKFNQSRQTGISSFEDSDKPKNLIEKIKYRLGKPSKDDEQIAAFLADVTIDESLDKKFWLSGKMSMNVTEEILLTVLMIEPARRLAAIQKFLAEQLRDEFQSNLTKMESTT